MKIRADYWYTYHPIGNDKGMNFEVSVRLYLPTGDDNCPKNELHRDLQQSSVSVFGQSLRPMIGLQRKEDNGLFSRCVSASFYGNSWGEAETIAKSAVEEVISTLKAVRSKNINAELSKPANKTEIFVLK